MVIGKIQTILTGQNFRQSSDPDFAQFLYWVSEDQQMNDDAIQRKTLAIDDPKADNCLKDKKVCGKLKEFEPSIARTKRFSLKEDKSKIIAERNQFSLMLGHAVTAYKS